MKGPEVDPRNPQKSQVLVFEISVLVRQRVVYLWGSLDSQPSLLGDLMASERAYLKTTMTKTKKKQPDGSLASPHMYIYSHTHVGTLRSACTCRHTHSGTQAPFRHTCTYMQTQKQSFLPAE